MNRFYYYLILINMFANIISLLTKVLLVEKTNGAIQSMILGWIVGLVFIYLFVSFFYKFPGKGLPELLKQYSPKWFYTPYLFLIGVIWFLAGLTSLITYTFIIKRFLTPDMPLIQITIVFLIVVSFGILMKSISVLYALEVILLFTLPLILFFIFKALTSDEFEWQFVMEAMMYVHKLPTYSAFSASFYVFLGIVNILIFNRLFKAESTKIRLRDIVLLGIIGALFLAVTYFVPIGMNGFDHIEDLTYPAVTTSDTLRMPYGIVERVLYLFLAFFLALTFLSLLVHWHVAMEAFKEVVWIKKFQWRNKNLTPYLFIVIFWIISIQLSLYITEYQLYQWTEFFSKGTFIYFLIKLCIFWIILRRARHAPYN